MADTKFDWFCNIKKKGGGARERIQSIFVRMCKKFDYNINSLSLWVTKLNGTHVQYINIISIYFLWQLYNMTPGKVYGLLKMTNFTREKLATCFIFFNANISTK